MAKEILIGQINFKKPVLNIMPPVYSNMFKSGKTIITEKT